VSNLLISTQRCPFIADRELILAGWIRRYAEGDSKKGLEKVFLLLLILKVLNCHRERK
jgi:hypothetical protein